MIYLFKKTPLTFSRIERVLRIHAAHLRGECGTGIREGGWVAECSLGSLPGPSAGPEAPLGAAAASPVQIPWGALKLQPWAGPSPQF